MSKDPAFLLYSSDFLTGCADLTMDERGQFITLLCLSHQKGGLSEKTIKISCPNVSKDVLAKFDLIDGLYFNPRLEKEREKRAKHSEKQRENALKRWNKDSDPKDMRPHSDGIADAMPLEDENEDENRDRIKDKDEKTFSPDVEKFYEASLKYFPEHLRPNTEAKVKAWKDTIDKLERIDDIPLNVAGPIVKWAREDEFWSTNFLSLTKLRKSNGDGVKYIQVFAEKMKTSPELKKASQRERVMRSIAEKYAS